MSPKWIASLFNQETSRLTPLDFRLTAAAQFRLIAAMCSNTIAAINGAIKNFHSQGLVSFHPLVSEVLLSQSVTLVNRFRSSIIEQHGEHSAFDLIMFFIRMAHIYSAVHTSAFVMSQPDSDQYQAVNNFYPLYDNVSFSNVSLTLL